MAHPIATDPAVVAKLGMALAAAAVAEAAGTASEKWRRRKYEGRGESTPMMVYFASRRG
jgi:hypothetical protein